MIARYVWARPALSGLIAALVLSLVLMATSSVATNAAASRVVSAAAPTKPWVALTFDDGWSRSACASITRTLRRQHVTGTFFINGSLLAKAPAQWRRILRGQQVGNHATRHIDLVPESTKAVRRQLYGNEAVHERILGRPMLKAFRPPYGSSDARVRRIAGDLGYRHTVLWNVYSGDAKRATSVEEVTARSTGAAPGSIILMHCKDNSTPEALPEIIRHYQQRGIRMVGLKQLLGIGS